MSWKKRGCAFVGILALLVVVAGAIGLWYVDSQYGAVFAAPRVDHLADSGLKPSIRLVVDPSQASDQIRAVIGELAKRDLPPWIVTAFLPYEFSVIVESVRDTDEISLDVLLNERRLGPLIASQINAADVIGRFSKIVWDTEDVQFAERGRITLHGHVPVEQEAKEEAYFRWSRTMSPAPLPLEGGHFIELVADNREGGAWLAGASLMAAYDYNLDEDAKEVVDGVSLASFQFVTEIRAVVDLLGENAARFRMSMEVIEEHRHKLAVINVQAFLDDVFERMTKNFQEKHQIQFAGESRWEENVLVYEYELGDVRQTLELIATGKLFQGDEPAAAPRRKPR